jgi:hypothetical protein
MAESANLNHIMAARVQILRLINEGFEHRHDLLLLRAWDLGHPLVVEEGVNRYQQRLLFTLGQQFNLLQPPPRFSLTPCESPQKQRTTFQLGRAVLTALNVDSSRTPVT